MRLKSPIAAGIWLVVTLFQLVLMAMPIGVPRTKLRAASFDTGELLAATVISQTFVVAASGLNRITLFASGAGQPATGSIVVSLVQLSHIGEQPLHQQTVNSQTITERSSWTFSFAPIDHSNGQTYRIDLTPARGTNRTGVRFGAAARSAYERGTMMVNSRPMPADLRFRAGTVDANAIRRLWRRYRGEPLLAALVGFVLVAQNVAVWFVLRTLTTSYSRRL